MESLTLIGTVKNKALTIGIGYTIYHLLHYKEIPLGGLLIPHK